MPALFATAAPAALAYAEFKKEDDLISLWTLPDRDIDAPDFPDFNPTSGGSDTTVNPPIRERDNSIIQFDGQCVGCIAAGGVFCMDGDNNSNHNV